MTSFIGGRTTAINGASSLVALIADFHICSCKPLTLASKVSIWSRPLPTEKGDPVGGVLL